MDVTFTLTGPGRYAVAVVTEPGAAPLVMDPAVGFDRDLPHDLAHYVVETELGLRGGVFGRIAAGGGGFHEAGESARGRDAARAARRRRRREEQLARAYAGDMALSETLAQHCVVAWKLRRGLLARPPVGYTPRDGDPAVRRVVDALDEVAAAWGRLRVGESVTFRRPVAR